MLNHSVLVHFVRNGPAYLPEIDAYVRFIESRGQQALVHDTAAMVRSLAGNAQQLQQAVAFFRLPSDASAVTVEPVPALAAA